MDVSATIANVYLDSCVISNADAALAGAVIVTANAAEKAIASIDKPIIVAITAAELSEVHRIAKLATRRRDVLIEVELNAHNIEAQLSRVLGYRADVGLGIRLPMLTSARPIGRIAEMIRERGGIAFVTCCSPAPLGVAVDADLLSIGRVKPQCKEISLAMVYLLSKALPGTPIIGYGGADTARDVCEYIICGAAAVQVDPDDVDSIVAELKAHYRGYSSVGQMRGFLSRL